METLQQTHHFHPGGWQFRSEVFWKITRPPHQGSPGIKIRSHNRLVWKLYVGISLAWYCDKGTVQLGLPLYFHAALHWFQHDKTKIEKNSPYPRTSPQYYKNNNIISENLLAENLDAIHHKLPHKIVAKLLYYAREIYSTVLIALNSIAEVQTKPIVETEKIFLKLLRIASRWCNRLQ